MRKCELWAPLMAFWKPGAVRTVLPFQEKLRRPYHHHLTMWSSREWKTYLTRLSSEGRKFGQKYELLRPFSAGNHKKLISPEKCCLVCPCIRTDLGLPGQMGTMYIKESGVWVGKTRKGWEMREQKQSSISPSYAPEFQGLLGGRVVKCELTAGGLLPQGWSRQQLGMLQTVLGG